MPKTCNVQGCKRHVAAKGLCIMHYKRFRNHGSTDAKRRVFRGTTREKFDFYLDKKNPNQCWPWTGPVDKNGYGRVCVKTKSIGAHRMSYEIHTGKIPKGLGVLHKCNNPACCNPLHLYCGTQQENMKDKISAGNLRYGEDHQNTKINSKSVLEIKSSTDSYQDLASRFNCSRSQIYNIKSGRQRVNG